jgi:hypothetical protein
VSKASGGESEAAAGGRSERGGGLAARCGGGGASMLDAVGGRVSPSDVSTCIGPG